MIPFLPRVLPTAPHTTTVRTIQQIFQFPAHHLTSAFTFDAGVQWFEAYQAAQQHNRVIVGGISQRGSVGAAGGWLQGGGHSLLAPNYGLGTPTPALRQSIIPLIPPSRRRG